MILKVFKKLYAKKGLKWSMSHFYHVYCSYIYLTLEQSLFLEDAHPLFSLSQSYVGPVFVCGIKTGTWTFHYKTQGVH